MPLAMCNAAGTLVLGLSWVSSQSRVNTHKRTKTLLNMWFNNKAVRACVCFCCRAISGSRGGPCRAVPALCSPLEGGVQMWCICRAFVRRVLCEHKVPFAVNGSHTQSAMCSVVLPACSSPLSKPARDCTRSLPTLPTPGEQSKTEGLRQGRRRQPKVCFKRQRCPHSSSEHACIACCLQNPMVKVGLQGAGSPLHTAWCTELPGLAPGLGTVWGSITPLARGSIACMGGHSRRVSARLQLLPTSLPPWQSQESSSPPHALISSVCTLPETFFSFLFF